MAKGNKGGRPEKWTKEASLKFAQDILDWMKEDVTNMYYYKYVVEIRDFYPQLISELCEKHTEFSETIKKCEKIQENRLLEGSTFNQFNPTSVIFQLKNNHGYRDKQEVEQTGMTEVHYYAPEKDNSN